MVTHNIVYVKESISILRDMKYEYIWGSGVIKEVTPDVLKQKQSSQILREEVASKSNNTGKRNFNEERK